MEKEVHCVLQHTGEYMTLNLKLKQFAKLKEKFNYIFLSDVDTLSTLSIFFSIFPQTLKRKQAVNLVLWVILQRLLSVLKENAMPYVIWKQWQQLWVPYHRFANTFNLIDELLFKHALICILWCVWVAKSHSIYSPSDLPVMLK